MSVRAAALRGPGQGPWTIATPESAGLSRPALDRAADILGAAGERQGLVVVRGGQIVHERYWASPWHQARPDWRNVSFSSGKSWGATMVGRALSQGLLGLDDLAAKYHPVAVSGLRPETTIRQLLTMTSGGTLVVKPSSKPPRRLDDPAPPGPGVEYARQPVGEPGSPPGYGRDIPAGSRFYYDGAAADHLADIVAAASGHTSLRYMMDEVVAPLGCETFRYQPEGVDAAGQIRIGGSIELSCRDMARLGQLYLDKGVWGGRPLIDAAFIGAATTPSPLNPSYGFLWWLNTEGKVTHAPRDMYFAAGARGQFCFVCPSQDLVVATMGFGAAQLTADQAWAALAPALLGGAAQ
jgi:CubicO group peptidase (beta-lactamase class C family)